MINTSTGDTKLEDINKKLIDSILSGKINSIREVLKEGGDINYRDEEGLTPLIHFLINYRGENSLEVFKMILMEGASINRKNKKNSTPLMFLSESSIPHKLSIACVLIENDKSTNHQNIEGISPLMSFSSYSNLPYNLKIMQLLLLNGADPNLMDKDGNTALGYSAMWSDSTKAIHLLVKQGADINLTKKNGYSPLMAACQSTGDTSSIDVVKTLIELEADVNQFTDKGTPLSVAAEYSLSGGSLETVRVLLDAGADVNLADKWGATPLIKVCASPESKITVDIVRILLGAGADPIKVDNQGRSPLSYVIMKSENDSHYETIKTLIMWAQARGRRYKDEDEFIFDALQGGRYLQGLRNNHRIISELIRSSFSVDNTGKDDMTPLMLVTSYIFKSREKIDLEDSTLDILLKGPADLETINCNGDNVIDLILKGFNWKYSTKVTMRQKMKTFKILMFFIKKRSFLDNKGIYIKAFIRENFGRRRYHKMITFIAAVMIILGYVSFWRGIKALFILYIFINLVENLILRKKIFHFIKRSLSTSLKTFLFGLSINLLAEGKFGLPIFLIMTLDIFDVKADK